ncbi:MAG TPA: group III truncated hemoglobin [Verrucomicrobiota bacterium]|nr:group III truncated hemoglobin [Verrucomicrobiota bacterium]
MSGSGDDGKASIYERMGGAPALKDLLRHFYADVRQDRVLAPIFEARIHDWPKHLETIQSFWARQTGGPSNYAGGFATAHLPLDLQEEHFQRWLGLWERQCRQQFDPEVADLLIQRALEIGRHLRRIIAGERGMQISNS